MIDKNEHQNYKEMVIEKIAEKVAEKVNVRFEALYRIELTSLRKERENALMLHEARCPGRSVGKFFMVIAVSIGGIIGGVIVSAFKYLMFKV